MIRGAFIVALALSAFSLPLAVAASLGGSQESVEAIVKPNFAPDLFLK
jgi:hypothetical protein